MYKLPTKLDKLLRILWRHRGDWHDYSVRLHPVAEEAIRTGAEGLEVYANNALKMIADERNLYSALNHMALKGGNAPGPDGMTISELSNESDRWTYCRSLRDALKDQSYKPGEVCHTVIPKSSGDGFRTIAIQNLHGRIVCRGIKQVLEPVIDPIFGPNSFGYRPGRDRSHMLLRAIEIARAENRLVWCKADIANAFENVPLRPVLELLKHRLPSNALHDLLAKCLGVKRSRKGLLQGSSISPLCLNLFLHHKLDLAWQKRYPNLQLLRFADDILIPARNEREAKKSLRNLDHLLRSTGMSRKISVHPDFADLRCGDRITMLGFDCGLVNDKFDVTIGTASLRKFRYGLIEHSGSPFAAEDAACDVYQWLKAQAPAYSKRHARGVVRAIVERLKDIGVASRTVGGIKLGRQRDWLEYWQHFHAVWRKSVAKLYNTPF